jgi:Zn/Cd-binding protein ZinT
VCRKPANQIENEYCFSDHTVGPSQTDHARVFGGLLC